jgi:regulatory protein
MSGKITALQIQQRRKDRVNVFLDGEYALSLQDILAARLRVGQELDDQQIAALQQRDVVEGVYERVLNYLSFRPRSEAEIRRYLQKKKLDSAGIDDILARLVRTGLVSDHDFAQFWVENREAHHPRGARALRSELRQKGIAGEIIESALGAVDEEASALEAAQRVVRRLEHLDEQTFRRRLLGLLQRRGFGYDISKRVTDRLWKEVTSQQETNRE